MRHHTNIALLPTRRLAKQYNATAARVTTGGTNALGNANPNTLNSNKPSKRDATGVAGNSGIVSFVHNGASQVINLWFWLERLNNKVPAQGWVKAAEGSAGASKTVDQYALCTFTAPEGTPFYLSCTGIDVTEVWITGVEDQHNPNTDKTDA